MIARLPVALTLGISAFALGPASARPPKPEQAARITAAGPAKSCIPLNAIDHMRVRDDRTIDFYMRDRRIYRSVLPQPCPELGSEGRFGYATSLGQLCSTDIITVLRETPLMRGASCGLGAFQPIAGAPRD